VWMSGASDASSLDVSWAESWPGAAVMAGSLTRR
jgi:hypothetical protein